MTHQFEAAIADRRWTRRELIRLTGITVLGAVAAACSPGGTSTPIPTVPVNSPVGTKEVIESPPLTVPHVPDPGKLTITDNADFYITSIQMVPPEIDPKTYKVEITGLVERPMTLTLDEIKARPKITEMHSLMCISNPVGGNLIGNAVWEGCSFADLLKEAGVKSQAIEVKMSSADGYSSSVPVATAMDPYSRLIYHMNSQPLPAEHGFPLRVFYAGRYGMKQPKWIQRIELIDRPYSGYWESQGWSNDAFIKPFSAIRVPEDGGEVPLAALMIYGQAFSGAAGIAKVEVSTDEGKSWTEAELTRGPEPLTPYIWTEWHFPWTPSAAGNYTLAVRATTNDGVTQKQGGFSLLGGAFPDGTDGIHFITLKVRG
jgi:DMSO/TMAO reductase YedYZ molybdopterin-dependent catalytic subunit